MFIYDTLYLSHTCCTVLPANVAKYSRLSFFLIKKKHPCTKKVGVRALCEREGHGECDTVKIDGVRICLQEKKRDTSIYHCIPCRHFIFSALGGHVINRSQVMSPPYRSCTVTSFTVYILYKCTRTVIVCFTTSIFLQGIHSKCMCVIYTYIICYVSLYRMYVYKCVVHALALLDCLVASFVGTHKYVFKHVPVVYTGI